MLEVGRSVMLGSNPVGAPASFAVAFEVVPLVSGVLLAVGRTMLSVGWPVEATDEAAALEDGLLDAVGSTTTPVKLPVDATDEAAALNDELLDAVGSTMLSVN